MLTFVICHGECHIVVSTASHYGIQLHIFAEVMHPAHVPLKCKSKAVCSDGSGNIRPCGRLFRNGDKPGISSSYHGIQMLEKYNGIQILIVTVLIGKPLSLLLAVIQIQH